MPACIVILGVGDCLNRVRDIKGLVSSSGVSLLCVYGSEGLVSSSGDSPVRVCGNKGLVSSSLIFAVHPVYIHPGVRGHQDIYIYI